MFLCHLFKSFVFDIVLGRSSCADVVAYRVTVIAGISFVHNGVNNYWFHCFWCAFFTAVLAFGAGASGLVWVALYTITIYRSLHHFWGVSRRTIPWHRCWSTWLKCYIFWYYPWSWRWRTWNDILCNFTTCNCTFRNLFSLLLIIFLIFILIQKWLVMPLHKSFVLLFGTNRLFWFF